MELVETAWIDFRNLRSCRFRWRPGLNVLTGPNGSGKSNLLESLSVLCGWGAFPGNRAALLPAWDGDGRSLLVAHAEGERTLDVRAAVSSRISLRADGERVSCSALRGRIPSLFFLPGDIDLLDGPPSIRRLFLDRIGALLSPLYARRLAEYRYLVRQRTALLRRGFGDSPELRATILPLAQLGGWLRARRFQTVTLLEENLSGINSPRFFPFSVKLTPVIRGKALETGNVPASYSDPASAASEMLAALRESQERERHARTVLVGPHRDDLLFSCEGRAASVSLSRGQKRRVVAGAVLAAGRLIEARMRMLPILLLDDIAAELDADGRRMLGEALAATGWQVFVTGTENPFEEKIALTHYEMPLKDQKPQGALSSSPETPSEVAYLRSVRSF